MGGKEGSYRTDTPMVFLLEGNGMCTVCVSPSLGRMWVENFRDLGVNGNDGFVGSG